MKKYIILWHDTIHHDKGTYVYSGLNINHCIDGFIREHKPSVVVIGIIPWENSSPSMRKSWKMKE